MFSKEHPVEVFLRERKVFTTREFINYLMSAGLTSETARRYIYSLIKSGRIVKIEKEYSSRPAVWQVVEYKTEGEKRGEK